MQKRVTLQDIGRRLGVHQSTVTRALRNDPSIPAETCQKVQQTAREMGYQPDPVAKALAVYRTRTREAEEFGTLAWISHGKAPTFHPDYMFHEYVEGAQKRAAELGYRIDEFPYRTPGQSARRLTQILKTRGIRGILVAPDTGLHTFPRVKLDWTGFSGVGFGHNLLWPPIHRVTHNHYRAARQAVHKLHGLGYRRIGLCAKMKQVEGNWIAGYWMEMQARKLPAVWLEEDGMDLNQLQAWIRKHRLEGVIGGHENICQLLQTKFRIPDELGLAALHLTSPESSCAGIHNKFSEVGATGVNLLVSLLHQNESGIPATPYRLLIEGEWQEGRTVRRLSRRVD